MATAKAAVRRPRKTKSVEEGPLAHLIPDPSVAEDYIHRTLNGVEDHTLFRYARDTKKNVLIFGPTGAGKTKMLASFCAIERLPLVTVQCNGGIDPTTAWGTWVPNTDPDNPSPVVWGDSDLTQLLTSPDPRGGVLYLNEINFLPQKIAPVFYGVLDWRRQLTILEKQNAHARLNPNVLIVADGNEGHEYLGTKPLNAALRNRFPIKTKLTYDDDVEEVLIYTASLREVAKELRAAFDDGLITTPISTNMLVELEEFAVDLGLDFALENFYAAFNADDVEAVKERLDLKRSILQADIEEWTEEIGLDDDQEDVEEVDPDDE